MELESGELILLPVLAFGYDLLFQKQGTQKTLVSWVVEGSAGIGGGISSVPVITCEYYFAKQRKPLAHCHVLSTYIVSSLSSLLEVGQILRVSREVQSMNETLGSHVITDYWASVSTGRGFS